MRLDGEQCKNFQEALIDAFPETDSLQQMLMHQMSVRLTTISTKSNLSKIIFDLIEWAEAQGKTSELVDAASKANPGNASLKEFVQWYHEQPVTQSSIRNTNDLLNSMPIDTLPNYPPFRTGSRMPYAVNPHFVGRTDNLKAIAAALKQDAHPTMSIVAITGMGGIGKTQLAVEFVRRYGHYFSGGVFWLSFADPDNIPLEIATCGETAAMDIPNFINLSLDQQIKKVQEEWEKPTPRLLIFDNCEDEKTLQQWMPKSGGCRILVTSRWTLWNSILNIQVHPLQELLRAESIALLREKFCHKVDETDADLNELAAALGDLPLALDLAGDYLDNYRDDITIQTYLTELRDKSLLKHESLQGIDRTISPTNHELHVGKTFAISYKKLETADKKDQLSLALLAHVAWFAPDEAVPRNLLLESIRKSEATRALKESESINNVQATRALNRLANLGLLEINKEHTPHLLRLHRLLGEFVKKTGTNTQAHHDVFQTILQYVTQASEEGEVAKIIPIHAHVLHVLSGKVNDETTDTLERIDSYIAMADSAALLRDVGTAKKHYETADALLQKHKHDLPTDERISLLARLCYGMGTLLEYTDKENALKWLNKGLAVLKESGSRDEAKLAFRKGALCNGKELFAESKEFLTKAHTLFGKDDESIWMIRTLSNLGIAESSQGNLVEGKRWYDKALTLCQKTNNRYEQTVIYNNLAYDFDLGGDWKQSAESYQKALELAEEFHDTEFLVRTPLNMGILYTNMGDDKSALTYLDRSIEHACKYAIDEVLILALMAKADLYIRQEKWNEARTCIEEAEKEGKARSDIIARQKNEIDRGWALIYLAQGNQDTALEYAQKCIVPEEEGTDAETGADANMEMGINYRVLGQVTFAFANRDNAIDHFRTSLSYVKDDVPYEAARTHLEWGRAELERGSHTEAKNQLSQARTVFSELGAKRDLALVDKLEREMVSH